MYKVVISDSALNNHKENNMKVLITGGAGFIGSNLAEYLLNEGHSVRILDDFSNGRRENLEGLQGELEVIEGSIEDAETCKKACGDGVDVVSHQAALGSVPRSIKFPELYSQINLHGFVNMVNAARQADISRFVYASSSSVYGDSQESPKFEAKTGRPLSPYAASKISNEMFAHAFASVYPISLIGLRYFNVFGPRQNPEGAYAAVIPLFVKHIYNGTSASIFGDGEQSRDFTFINNVIQANFKAMTSPDIKGSHAINIACGHSYSVNDLFNAIKDILGKECSPEYLEPRLGDVRSSLADISAAKELIGYNPTIQLQEGLKKTVEWFVKTYQ
ncbi:MAG: SDR family oxidoreductase [Fibrobacteria bacterium]|nr:SDR family oxidoreductase [Fibrobacteria bacterium]